MGIPYVGPPPSKPEDIANAEWVDGYVRGFQFAQIRDLGAWAANTAYLAGDIVVQGGIRYMTRVAYTSGASFATVINSVQVVVQMHDAAGASQAPKIELYTTPGAYTWTKDANARVVEMTAISGGNSGAPGMRNTNSAARTGGAGGYGGSKSYESFVGSALPSSISITVGAGGAAPADITASGTSTYPGNSGQDSIIAGFLEAKAPMWSGLNQVQGVGNRTQYASTNFLSSGGSGSSIPVQAMAASAAGSGGGGSGATTGNVGTIGGAGGDGESGISVGRAAPAVNTAPSSYTDITTYPIRCGAGGPGGGVTGSAVGGAGAAGQSPGGGGGGGSAGNGSFAGKGGGKGGDGAIQIITYY